MGKVAAIQMTSSHFVAENLAAAGEYLRQAKDQGAEIACLPENFSFIGLKDADKLQVAETDGEGVVQAFLSNTARKLKMWILGGTHQHQRRCAETRRECIAADRCRRQAGCALRQNALVRRHHSRPQRTVPGIQPCRCRDAKSVVADTPVGRLGLSVCYDMRFPELYRELVSRGAEWLAMPAAFTVPTGRAHWETLLRARAIENLCYVVAPAQIGLHSSGRETYGDSLIVDYWGQVLSSLAAGHRSDFSRHRSCGSSGIPQRAFRRSITGSWACPKPLPCARTPRRRWHERAQRRIAPGHLRGGREDDPGALGPR